MREYARAAQGAGTAPVETYDGSVRKSKAWAYARKLAREEMDAAIGQDPASVSTAAATTEANDALGKQVYRALYSDPEYADELARAAATTASAIRTVVCSDSTVYVCAERDIECGNRSVHWCASCPKRRAADGQQFKLPAPIARPLVVYCRDTVDPDDSNTRTTSVDVARRWKSNGSFVTPDPETTNA
jgi:hypothetical protein